jgi:hypothetical protein
MEWIYGIHSAFSAGFSAGFNEHYSDLAEAVHESLKSKRRHIKFAECN